MPGLGAGHPRLVVDATGSRGWPGKQSAKTVLGTFCPAMTRYGLLGDELFRLRDPAFDAAGQSDLLADLLGIGAAKLGDLRVVEYAEVVELLLDRAGDAGQASCRERV